MDVRPIHTGRDYHEALQIVSGLVDADPAPGTPEGDRLEVLATLVERYEAEHFPLDLPLSKASNSEWSRPDCRAGTCSRISAI